MNTAKKLKMHKKIIDYLSCNPGEYIDICEIPSRIPLIKSNMELYWGCIQDIIAYGQVDCRGNSIKIVQ